MPCITHAWHRHSDGHFHFLQLPGHVLHGASNRGLRHGPCLQGHDALVGDTRLTHPLQRHGKLARIPLDLYLPSLPQKRPILKFPWYLVLFHTSMPLLTLLSYLTNSSSLLWIPSVVCCSYEALNKWFNHSVPLFLPLKMGIIILSPPRIVVKINDTISNTYEALWSVLST